MSGALDLTPRPGAASPRRRVLAQAGLELRTQTRNGEQLLLTVLIPVGLLLFLTWVPLGNVATDPRVAFVAPGILALAVMSTAFTGLAIQTGFERRYGVLKRLGSTPLTAGNLLGRQDDGGAGGRGRPGRADHGRGDGARLAPDADRRCRTGPAADGDGGLRRSRTAAGRHLARRGDAGSRQPGVPRAAAPGRDRGAAHRVPGRHWPTSFGSFPAQRWPRGCGRHSAPAPPTGGRSSPCSCSRPGRAGAVLLTARTFRWE